MFEALTSCVRHVEIEQSVREKLSKPKKVRKRLETAPNTMKNDEKTMKK